MPIPTERCDGLLDDHVMAEVGLSVWKEVYHELDGDMVHALVEFKITDVWPNNHFACAAYRQIDLKNVVKC